jgi:hypothetical protein
MSLLAITIGFLKPSKVLPLIFRLVIFSVMRATRKKIEVELVSFVDWGGLIG